MILKNSLTNEELKNTTNFKSQFELVNYAIRLAENMIKSGREPRVKIDSRNVAIQILAEIKAHKDELVDIKSPEEEQEEINSNRTSALSPLDKRQTPKAAVV